jgi:hypothetical protein
MPHRLGCGWGVRFTAAIFTITCAARRLKNRPPPPSTGVLPSTPPVPPKTDCTKFSRYPGCIKARDFARKPEVPGCWPSIGLVGMVRADMELLLYRAGPRP